MDGLTAVIDAEELTAAKKQTATASEKFMTLIAQTVGGIEDVPYTNLATIEVRDPRSRSASVSGRTVEAGGSSEGCSASEDRVPA